MRIPPKITMFFAFDTRLGSKEGREHEKIMFFYPNDDQHPIEFQSKTVGLSEAMINFTSTFSSKPCESVHQQKHRIAFYNAEPDIWFVMEVQNPSFASQKEGGSTIVWCEEELDDMALQTVVSQTYKAFKVFHGNFRVITEKHGLDGLKKRLAVFLPPYINSFNIDQLDLFNTLDGINFLAVDKIIYLRIQAFINTTENTFPQIRYTSFLFQDHLVWSGLELDDMRAVYRAWASFWTADDKKGQTSGFPFPVNRTPSSTSASSTSSSSSSSLSLATTFITGPENLDDFDSTINVPSIFISPQSDEYGFVIYSLRDAVCLFLIDTQSLNDKVFYRTLHNFIAPQLQTLGQELSQRKQQISNNEDPYRYLYFNHMNLALKSSLQRQSTPLSRETLRLLNEMHSDFERMQENVSEVMVRTQMDGWIVARKSDQRELYVIFDHKNDNLIEVNDEIKRFTSTYFGSIFLD